MSGFDPRGDSGTICEQVSLFGIGALDEREARAFELHLAGCPSCERELRSFGEIATALAMRYATPPPDSLRDRVLASVRSHDAPAAVVRSSEVEWATTPLPGIEVRRLFSDPVTGSLFSMVRMAAGAHYPAHIHAGMEHIYVLAGDLQFEDHALYAGDYEAASAETRHGSATSKEGCVILTLHHEADRLLR
jgi:quercetin dioxygenase-like cupin family protein